MKMNIVFLGIALMFQNPFVSAQILMAQPPGIREKAQPVPSSGQNILPATFTRGTAPPVSAAKEFTVPATHHAAAGAASPTGWVTIMNQTFEGSFPPGDGLWSVFNSTSYTAAYWDDVNYRAHAGSWSAWCAAAGSEHGTIGGTYPANMRTWMIYGPFSLSDANDAKFEFYYWIVSESGFDKLYWGASLDGTNFGGYSTSGNSQGWAYESLDLKTVPIGGTPTNLMGNSQVWIAVAFWSDGSTQYEGAYVDDLLLSKNVGSSVAWTSAPPSTAQVYTDYTVSWYISSLSTVTHTDVHCEGPETFTTTAQSGSSGLFSATLNYRRAGLYNVYSHAQDGVSDYYSPSVTVTVPDNFQNPTVSITNPPVVATAGNDLAITASAHDPSGIRDFYLLYYTGKTPKMVSFTATTDGIATIPGYDVSAQGLNYVVAAKDNTDSLGVSNYYSVADQVPPSALTYQSSGGTDVSAYRLFSVPLNLEDKRFSAFFSDANALGDPGTNWRFFAYENRTPVEYGAQSTEPLVPGKAYFMILRNPLTLNSRAGATNMELDYNQTGYPLSAGWNLVGNPMAFDLWLSDLGVSPYTNNEVWSWTGAGGWSQSETKLKSWEGIAVRVDESTHLMYPLFPNPGAAPVPGPRAAHLQNLPFEKRVGGHMTANASTEWIMCLLVSDGTTSDRVNYIGVKQEANDGYDSYDLHEPPFVPGAISLSFNRDDWGNRSDYFAADIRHPNDTGYVWKSEVSGKPLSEIRFRAEELSKFPVGFKSYALLDNGMLYNLLEDPSFVFPVGNGTRLLTLLVGTDAFLKSHAGRPLVPREFALRQNYPNPFNPVTNLQYEIPMQSHVSISVYSILGEHVYTLLDGETPPGYHEVRWDGTDLNGRPVPSGIYFCRMLAGSYSQTRKMLLLR